MGREESEISSKLNKKGDQIIMIAVYLEGFYRAVSYVLFIKHNDNY